MKKLAYFKITEDMTPRDASDILALAKKAGYDDVLVYHHEKADITKGVYKEQLLSVFRAAYRHKVGLYIADDRYDFSGTGFGQLSSVKSLWQKVMMIKKKEEVAEGEEVLCERDGECVVATLPKDMEKFPYGHMPDLTNPECAHLIIESVYKPLINEYKKFVGYEFKGFLCNCPICDCAEYEHVPYSKKTLEKFMEYSQGAGDLFAVAAMENTLLGYDDYLDFLDIDESFALPLKKFCEENGLEFAVATGDSSVSTRFGEEKSSIFIHPYGSGCYKMNVTNAYEAVNDAYKYKMEPVVKIGYGMEKTGEIGQFFKACPNCEVYDLKDFKDSGKDGYVLVNNSEERISLGLLSWKDWVVYDWEKGEVYDFEKKTYTFYPHGFLCLMKKEKDMYPEVLPVRVGDVTTGDYEVEKYLDIEWNENVVKFNLPETALTGKCVELAGDSSFVKVKVGYNEYCFTSECRVIPLYDFLGGAQCMAYAVDGKIEEIRILKKTD